MHYCRVYSIQFSKLCKDVLQRYFNEICCDFSSLLKKVFILELVLQFPPPPPSSFSLKPILDPWCSLFTDPLFSLQSPSSARDKLKTAGGLLTATLVLARSLRWRARRCFQKNEKKNKTTSVSRLFFFSGQVLFSCATICFVSWLMWGCIHVNLSETSQQT